MYQSFFKTHGFYLHDNIGVSKYFKWSEALWLPKMKVFAFPNSEQVRNIKKLASNLDKVRESFGRPIIITSWLRPPEYNAMIGGAPRSSHMNGLAVDFVVKGLDCNFVKQELMHNKIVWPYRGEIDTTNWIHLDLNGDRWFYAKNPNK